MNVGGVMSQKKFICMDELYIIKDICYVNIDEN